MKMLLETKSGGALLLAVISAFLLCFASAGLIAITSNQVAMTQEEINRVETIHLLRSAYIYAYTQIFTGVISQYQLQQGPVEYDLDLRTDRKVKVKIESDLENISEYRIIVTRK